MITLYISTQQYSNGVSCVHKITLHVEGSPCWAKKGGDVPKENHAAKSICCYVNKLLD